MELGRLEERLVLPTAAMTLFAMSAFAMSAQADSGWYAGASVGQAYVEIPIEGTGDSTFGFDEDATAWKAFGGYAWDLPLVNLGLEAGYVDLANPSAQFPSFRAEFSPKGFNVWGVAGVDLGPVGVFGKLGALDWEIEGDTTGSIERNFKESGTDLGYGVGLKFMLWSLEFRAEYENYDIEDTDNVEMLSFGAAWVF